MPIKKGNHDRLAGNHNNINISKELDSVIFIPTKFSQFSSKQFDKIILNQNKLIVLGKLTILKSLNLFSKSIKLDHSIEQQKYFQQKINL